MSAPRFVVTVCKPYHVNNYSGESNCCTINQDHGLHIHSIRKHFIPLLKTGKNLQAQYERWQARAKYKMHLDPTVDDVKKLCVSQRRNAKVNTCKVDKNMNQLPFSLVSVFAVLLSFDALRRVLC